MKVNYRLSRWLRHSVFRVPPEVIPPLFLRFLLALLHPVRWARYASRRYAWVDFDTRIVHVGEMAFTYQFLEAEWERRGPFEEPAVSCLKGPSSPLFRSPNP